MTYPCKSSHPLGPLTFRTNSFPPPAVRLSAAAILLGVGAILVLMRSIEPPAVGYGAHQKLGLAPCPMPLLVGLPCPSCGMTTALTHFARGNLLTSLHTQPAGFAAAAILVLIAVFAAEALMTGRPRAINWYRITPPRITAGVIAIILLGWGYKLVTTLVRG